MIIFISLEFFYHWGVIYLWADNYAKTHQILLLKTKKINIVYKNGHVYLKKHISSIYVESFIGLWKSAQFFDCAATLS